MYLPPLQPGQEWLGVVIAIPEPLVSELTHARLGFGDTMGASVPAHITLMPPIPVYKDQREDVIRHLRTVAASHRPFHVSLRGAGTFRPTSPVVFVNVDDGAKECSMLADDIRSGPLEYELRFPYHPHVTLAHGVPEEQLDLAQSYGSTIDESWLVPGFRLDRVNADGVYSSTALFDLDATS